MHAAEDDQPLAHQSRWAVAFAQAYAKLSSEKPDLQTLQDWGSMLWVEHRFVDPATVAASKVRSVESTLKPQLRS